MPRHGEVRSVCHIQRRQMRNSSFVASTDLRYAYTGRCHILERCRIVGPRYTCVVPRPRAGRPLLVFQGPVLVGIRTRKLRTKKLGPFIQKLVQCDKQVAFFSRVPSPTTHTSRALSAGHVRALICLSHITNSIGKSTSQSF